MIINISGVMTEFNASQLDWRSLSTTTSSTKSTNSSRKISNSFLDGISANHALVYPAYKKIGKKNDLCSLGKDSYKRDNMQDRYIYIHI
jgi:hypothetical protein